MFKHFVNYVATAIENRNILMEYSRFSNQKSFAWNVIRIFSAVSGDYIGVTMMSWAESLLTLNASHLVWSNAEFVALVSAQKKRWSLIWMEQVQPKWAPHHKLTRHFDRLLQTTIQNHSCESYPAACQSNGNGVKEATVTCLAIPGMENGNAKIQFHFDSIQFDANHLTRLIDDVLSKNRRETKIIADNIFSVGKRR